MRWLGLQYLALRSGQNMFVLVRPIDVAVSTKAAIQGNWLAHGGGFAWVDRPFSRSANSHWTFFCLNLLYVTLPHANGLTALMLFDQ